MFVTNYYWMPNIIQKLKKDLNQSYCLEFNSSSSKKKIKIIDKFSYDSLDFYGFAYFTKNKKRFGVAIYDDNSFIGFELLESKNDIEKIKNCLNKKSIWDLYNERYFEVARIISENILKTNKEKFVKELINSDLEEKLNIMDKLNIETKLYNEFISYIIKNYVEKEVNLDVINALSKVEYFIIVPRKTYDKIIEKYIEKNLLDELREASNFLELEECFNGGIRIDPEDRKLCILIKKSQNFDELYKLLTTQFGIISIEHIYPGDDIDYVKVMEKLYGLLKQGYKTKKEKCTKLIMKFDIKYKILKDLEKDS